MKESGVVEMWEEWTKKAQEIANLEGLAVAGVNMAADMGDEEKRQYWLSEVRRITAEKEELKRR